MKKISVVSHISDQDVDPIVDGNKALFLAKGLAFPVTIATLRKGKLGIANGQIALKIFPKDMLTGNAEALSEDCVIAITLTESSNMHQTESSRVIADYSSMLASNLACQ